MTTHPHTIDALSQDLNARRADIEALAGQINDDPDLYDADTETVSDAGRELIADHLVQVNRGGRPEVGRPINVRLGDELLAKVDAEAARRGASRADTVRGLVEQALPETP